MKILLIAPYIDRSFDRPTNSKVSEVETLNREDFIPSTALLCLGAMLRENNYEPVLLDLNNNEVHQYRETYLDYCNKSIIDKINENKPELIGINCLFSGSFPYVLEYAKAIKSHSPHIKIAIGGMHPSTFPKEILSNCKDIDYISIGEGEKSMTALANSIKTKNENLLSSIKAFAYRDKDGEIKINRQANYIDDLNTLPMPAWDLLDIKKFEMNLDHYYNPPKLPLKYKAVVLTSRACPCECNFCDIFMVMGQKHRKRSVKLIVDELELLNGDYGVNYISFMDDNLTLNRAHIMDLCNELIKRKLHKRLIWDTPSGLWINSLREETIAKMVEAGFVKAAISVEHGNDYIRNKVIKKHLDRKKIYEVAALLKKYKVMTTGYFIMGFPEETHETLQDTYDMLEELQLDKSSVSTLMPFPGTSLFKQVVRDKLFLRNWNLNDLWKTPISLGQDEFIIKPYNLSVDELYKWREKFDKIILKYWHTNAFNPATLGEGLTPDSAGIRPRLNYGFNKNTNAFKA